MKQFKTFIEDKKPVDSINFYQWLSLSMQNLGVSHNDFWDMPFFMVVDLIKKVSPKTAEHKTRKEVLASMRYNKQKLGWV